MRLISLPYTNACLRSSVGYNFVFIVVTDLATDKPTLFDQHVIFRARNTGGEVEHHQKLAH